MRAESAPELWLPRINNGHGDRTAQPSTAHRAPFSSPVCVPCGKWPKFMIACILGPRLDGRRNPIRPPNEMPPCKNNKYGVWTRVCVVIVSAMQVMMRRGASSASAWCFLGPTNCGSHRCHALTHFSLPAFTRHPSFNLLILLLLQYACTSRRSTHAAWHRRATCAAAICAVRGEQSLLFVQHLTVEPFRHEHDHTLT